MFWRVISNRQEMQEDAELLKHKMENKFVKWIYKWIKWEYK